ncbi:MULTISPECIES: peptidase domain-containing ABC transporter [unclassified Sphingobacterium]|uniref:peptidase domain-containing ABC transporter n=1 Tax=unclassified Sphingobacterium TaxID=2609468 RepID=UPI00104F7DE3|nr:MULTISPECIES: peptidase domain-containing ABC transporter [unclassified Sphingobacterium]MCS3552702.1 ATP-binding cassette subfamily B protein [Sphingobacterium sp. JUb21]TCR10540.1 bacteriocin-processing peptidase [Sphingobacterium sp. JUb20]
MFNKFPTEIQYDKMDCGPTCLKIIAKHYGRFYTLHFLRELCGKTKEGISILNLIYAAEKIGLRSRAVKCTLNQLQNDIPLPVVIHWNDSHFMVVYKTTKNYIYVSDPAQGLVKFPAKLFVKKWIKENSKKGVLIGFDPDINFSEINREDSLVKHKKFNSIFSYFKPYKTSMVNLLIVMLFVTSLQAIVPFITRSIIDVGVSTQNMNFVNIMLTANIAILLATTFSNAVRDWIILHLTSRINISLISDYLLKLMKLPMSFFENKTIGDILQRAQDHQRIKDFIMGSSLNLLFSGMTFLIFAVILAIYNSFIFWVFIAGSVVYLIWVMAFLAIRRRLDTNYFSLMAKDQSYWVETISGMQDIKINNYETEKRWKWENLQARLYKVNLKLHSITNYQNLGGQFIDNLKNIIITIICAKAVINGEMSFGIMISTQIIIGMLNSPIQQFIQFITAAQSAKISFARINEIHALEDEEQIQEFNDAVLPQDRSIILKNVYFQYAPKHPYSVKGVNLTIPFGKITAIVGDSGSGKTTLMKLILRLYGLSHGEICIGPLNVKNIPLSYWRSKCGVVLQDGKIFNDTVINNVVLNDEELDFERFKIAIEIANIRQEIEDMPKGYKTMMGEQGRGLSGGQKQRILIARAIYKNPDYLFLDEATNSLDTLNEKKIVESLDKIFKDKTVVVIAHRLSTIRKADQIIVMKDGKIIEVGNHKLLMDKQGHYYDLINSQANLN